MKVSERRKKIKSELSKSNFPVKGQELAAKFRVSRQVIVQDIAVLKAEGVNVIATPNGYMTIKSDDSKLIRSIPVKHGVSEMEEELYIMVDNNAKVLDVMVEHPIYGEIKGNLNISSRADVDKLVAKLKESGELLSVLTGGIHIHSIEVNSEDDYEKIINELKQKELLLD